MKNIIEKLWRGSCSRFCRGAMPGCGVATMVLALVAGLLVSGCATIKQWGPDDREKLVKASTDYNNLLRWKDLDKACVTFAEESVRESCLARALKLKEINVTDIRTRDIDFRIGGADATVHVVIEYYMLPSTKVRTILDDQKWIYIGPIDKKVWRIKSTFPDFTTP